MTTRRSWQWSSTAAACALLAAACGGDGEAVLPGGLGGTVGAGASLTTGGLQSTTFTPGAGGTPGVVPGAGGMGNTGAASATGGLWSLGGSPNAGGLSSSGGMLNTGGLPSAGGMIAVGAGGVPSTGGTMAVGGSPSTGGAALTGGTPGTGGAVATGGATGGMQSTGGFVSTGGAQNTGGFVSTGGATGGTQNTGGFVSTGGASGCDGGPLSTSVANCDVTPLPSTGDYYQDCVNEINQFRWICQCLPPLERWTEAEDCANQQAQYDYETDTPHAGIMLGEDLCSPPGRGQNECPGWGSAESITQGTEFYESCLSMMWHEVDDPSGEQGHYVNMSNEGYSRVACGIYVTPEGEVWAVQNYE